MKSIKLYIQRYLSPFQPALHWWRQRYVYRVFWVCAMKRMSTKMMLACLVGGTLLYTDKLMWSPVLELDQMSMTSGIIEKITRSGGRFSRWRIRLRLDNREILWFDRTSTDVNEPKQLENSEGKKVNIWYQEEYSLLPPFHYRHARKIQDGQNIILAYKWILDGRKRYEANRTGEKFRYFYAGTALFGLIGILLMCCCTTYTPAKITKPKNQ